MGPPPSAPFSVAASQPVFIDMPIFAAILSFAIAQSLKVITNWYKEKHWDLRRLIGSGGMPSSHSATAMGLAASICLKDGPGSSLFAVAFVLAIVVMYDASSVRFQAGQHAEMLNQIVIDLPPEHPLADSAPLRELLGHTPLQVSAGGFLGCLIALLLYSICGGSA